MAKSFTTLTSMFTTLSQNSSTANQSLAGILMNDVHRYCLLRFFDNERSFTMTTVGPQVLTLTAATLAAGSTSATLTALWPSISCSQLVVFSDSEQRTVFFTQGSASIYWQSPTTTIQSSASISCVGVGTYQLPAQISKLKTSTITIGQLVYNAAPVNSIQEWVKLNALPYTAAYPAYFFVYNGTLSFWPIPSTTGYIITLYAQINTPDLYYTDTTGTIASAGMVQGSNLITTTATPFSALPQNVDLTFFNFQITAAPPYGDGLNYQIQQFTGNTTANTIKPISYSPNESGTGTFTLGQYPLLDPNFHDVLVYGALRTYFSSIAKDTDKAQYFGGIYNEKLNQMEYYLSTKQVNVDLGSTPLPRNPNVYPYPVK